MQCKIQFFGQAGPISRAQWPHVAQGNFMVNGFLKIQTGPIQFLPCVTPL